MKTLAEMEAEDPDIFKNPPSTPEEEALDRARWAKRLAEIDAMPEEPEEEEEEEEDEEEE